MHRSIPRIGLGVYKAGDAVAEAVRYAVSVGYRMIDCAKFYGSEEDVGRAIRGCGIPREELFIINKLWPTDFDRPQETLEESLKTMGLDYFDAYFLHWPGTDVTRRLRAYEAVCRMREQGKVGMVGASNFLPSHLESLRSAGLPKPDCGQLEIHPWYPQRETMAVYRAAGIPVICWAPIFRGAGARSPQLQDMAEAYHKTPAQLVLRWNIQRGGIPIPKSVTPSRILENISIFDFEISESDMERIDSLEDGRHVGKDPNTYDGG